MRISIYKKTISNNKLSNLKIKNCPLTINKVKQGQRSRYLKESGVNGSPSQTTIKLTQNGTFEI